MQPPVPSLNFPTANVDLTKLSLTPATDPTLFAAEDNRTHLPLNIRRKLSLPSHQRSFRVPQLTPSTSATSTIPSPLSRIHSDPSSTSRCTTVYGSPLPFLLTTHLCFHIKTLPTPIVFPPLLYSPRLLLRSPRMPPFPVSTTTPTNLLSLLLLPQAVLSMKLYVRPQTGYSSFRTNLLALCDRAGFSSKPTFPKAK